MSIVAGLIVVALGFSGNLNAPVPSIVPQPQEFSIKPGEFEILPSTVIVSSNETISEASKLASMLRKATGYPLPIRPTRPAKDYIEFELKPEMKWLGKEGYRVSVRPEYVNIRSFGMPGLFYGMQSFRQLMPLDIEKNEQVFRDWKVRSAEISDSPRFSWRGMHLDESRHFFGKDSVKKFIDTLSLYKFNKFHWHLVDDGGWRIEISKYPDLTNTGAWRIGDGRGYNHSEIFFNQNDGVYQVYGGYYTQEDIREVVQYAADRHIEIVPEIEMPGHSLPALWTHRHLACDEVSVNKILPSLRTQFVNTYCTGKEETYTFLTDILDEVIRLFPGRNIHIGGDEVDRRTWQSCTDCIAFRQQNALSGIDAQYVYFMQRMSSYIKSKGKLAVGWDDVLSYGYPQDMAVMNWLGSGNIKTTIQKGIPIIFANHEHAYFDRDYLVTPVKEVYDFDPMPSGLAGENQSLIWGGQGQLWSEKLETWGQVEQMAFPRTLAMSEALWTLPSQKNWDRFSKNLEWHIERLDVLNVETYVPRPEYEHVLVAFRDKAIIDPPSSSGGLNAKVTTDGSNPTKASEDFSRPLAVTSTRLAKVAFLRGSGAVGQPTSIQYLKYQSPSVLLEPGLWADWYEGRFRSVEGFSGTVERTGVETWANQWPFLNEPFGVRFTGYIRIPSDGTYTFSLRSDDGSQLKIAGHSLLSLDRVGSLQAGQVRLFLVKGDYPLELLYFNGGGDRELLWEVESVGFRRRSVPTEWLFRAK